MPESIIAPSDTCKSCGKTVEVAVEEDVGSDRKEFRCPHCGEVLGEQGDSVSRNDPRNKGRSNV
jgi:predicted RNA-binding Zn-ribbon protein involved in translation (DUF1610 family)